MKVLVVALLAASTAVYADGTPDGTLTLPDGAIAVAAVVGVQTRNIAARPPATAAIHDRTESFGLAVAAGLTSDITAGVTYALDLHDDSGSFPSGGRWKGPLLAHGEYLLDDEALGYVTVGGDVIVHLENPTDRAIHIGVGAALRISSLVSVFTGAPLPNGPVGQQLALQLSGNHPITLAVPVGVLVRPAPAVYGFVETTLASVALSHADNQFIIADFVPVDAGALVRATHDLDVGILFSDDLEHPHDVYTIGVTARFTPHSSGTSFHD